MNAFEQAREWIHAAGKVAVLTGAGISAESGIPTFRGPGGLWRERRPEDLATPQAFARDPDLVWQWYDWRRSVVASAEPNAGHRALAEFEQRKNVALTLVTQNVDGLHRRAGSHSILEIHGSIWTLRCTACGREWRDESVPLALPPLCICNAGLGSGQVRPGVVWFGEGLPADVWPSAENAAKTCDVFLVVGTSAVVYPAAGLIPIAKHAGARVVEVNVEATPMSARVDGVLQGRSAEILPELLR